VGVEGLKKALAEWEEKQERADEDFWQGMLDRYPFLVSHVLSYPVALLGAKA
jgi:hypothetical protein